MNYVAQEPEFSSVAFGDIQLALRANSLFLPFVDNTVSALETVTMLVDAYNHGMLLFFIVIFHAERTLKAEGLFNDAGWVAIHFVNIILTLVEILNI